MVVDEAHQFCTGAKGSVNYTSLHSFGNTKKILATGTPAGKGDAVEMIRLTALVTTGADANLLGPNGSAYSTIVEGNILPLKIMQLQKCISQFAMSKEREAKNGLYMAVVLIEMNAGNKAKYVSKFFVVIKYFYSNINWIEFFMVTFRHLEINKIGITDSKLTMPTMTSLQNFCLQTDQKIDVRYICFSYLLFILNQLS